MLMSRRQKISIGILTICVTAYVLFQTIGAKILAATISIQVIQNDAIEQCDSIRPRVFGGKYRTEPPKMQGFGFCGVIVTDHGGLVLPEPKLIWRMGVEDRAALDTSLLNGHCYDVVVHGFGKAPKRGDALANQGHWEIVSVVGEISCPS